MNELHDPTQENELSPSSSTHMLSENVINLDESFLDDLSTMLEFFTDDKEGVLLPDGPLSTMQEAPPFGSPLTLVSSTTSRSLNLFGYSTIQNTSSVETLVKDDSTWLLTPEELCQVIDKHHSMQHAEIVSAEGYKEWTGKVFDPF